MKNRWIRLAAVVVLTALAMSLGTVGAYALVVKPQYYSQYMETGQRCLDTGEYEQAILAYNKAITIESRSTDARLGAGRGYVGAGQTDEAVAVLQEAQDLDASNTQLLLEILEILRDAAPRAAYEMLQRYIRLVGEANVSPDMQGVIESSQEAPVTPLITPEGAAYATPVRVALTTDRLRVGHAIYYTLDGSQPDANATPYRGIFQLSEDTTVKAVSVGPDGTVSDCAVAQFTFQPGAADALRTQYDQARQEVDATQVGTEVGNCVEGAKEEVEPALEQARLVLERYDGGEMLPLAPVQTAAETLTAAMEAFRLKVIEPCDKTALEELIDEATQLYSDSQEGSADGQYRTGSRAALKTAIDAAQKVFDDILTRQEQADQAVADLERALETFDDNMVKLVVNPDGTNFTYGFKTLMGDKTSITYRGTFTVVNSGTANCYGGDVSMSRGETGTITLTFTREDNMVTVYAKESWTSGKGISTRGTWYAEYNGETQYFLLYPANSGRNASDRFEGYFTNGRMSGKVYYDGMGYALDFSATASS